MDLITTIPRPAVTTRAPAATIARLAMSLNASRAAEVALEAAQAAAESAAWREGAQLALDLAGRLEFNELQDLADMAAAVYQGTTPLQFRRTLARHYTRLPDFGDEWLQWSFTQGFGHKARQVLAAVADLAHARA